MVRILTTQFGLWIDTCLSTNNTLHGSSKAVEKSDILHQIENVAKSSGVDLTCYVFNLEDAIVHVVISNPSGVLTIEK